MSPRSDRVRFPRSPRSKDKRPRFLSWRFLLRSRHPSFISELRRRVAFRATISESLGTGTADSSYVTGVAMPPTLESSHRMGSSAGCWLILRTILGWKAKSLDIVALSRRASTTWPSSTDAVMPETSSRVSSGPCCNRVMAAGWRPTPVRTETHVPVRPHVRRATQALPEERSLRVVRSTHISLDTRGRHVQTTPNCASCRTTLDGCYRIVPNNTRRHRPPARTSVLRRRRATSIAGRDRLARLPANMCQQRGS